MLQVIPLLQTIGQFIADYWLALLAGYLALSVIMIAREQKRARGGIWL